MRKINLSKFSRLFLLSLFLALFALPAYAQGEDGLRLNISKVFGYSSGFGSGTLKLQGMMALTARGPETLQKVTFTLDNTVLGVVSQAPFKLNFNTDEFSLGEHILSAVGNTSDGRELRSNEIKTEFVSASEGWQAALKIAVPILVLVFAIMLVSFVAPMIFERGKKGAIPPGTHFNYGIRGGTICPKCSRPFPIHMYGLNMLTHKLDRCPHCGKWSLVRPRPLAELYAAEQAELAQAQEKPQVEGITEEEKLRKELENSRYDKS
jgi:hypothetical protein